MNRTDALLLPLMTEAKRYHHADRLEGQLILFVARLHAYGLEGTTRYGHPNTSAIRRTWLFHRKTASLILRFTASEDSGVGLTWMCGTDGPGGSEETVNLVYDLDESLWKVLDERAQWDPLIDLDYRLAEIVVHVLGDKALRVG